MRLPAYAGMVMVGLFFSGCSLKPLVIHDDDSTVERVGKVAVRTVLAPISFGATERRIGLHVERENYERWYLSLSPDEKRLEDQRRHELELARLRSRQSCTTQFIGNMAYTNCQ